MATLFDTLSRPFVMLEDRLTPGALARLYRDPVAVVRADEAGKVEGAFAEIQAGLAGGLHAAGFMAYELGYALEPRLAPLMPPARSGPLLWFGLFGAPRLIAASELDAAFAELGPPAPISAPRAGHDRGEHMAKVERILALIEAGDIYQANLTFPLSFGYGGDALALYGALRSAQPVAHGGVIGLEEATILSVSPELFVEVSSGQATARPMKGTAARRRDPAADAEARAGLVADPKQRAENLMIVDLLRNDLSRISRPGGVRTPALFTVETYPTFHTLTSTVTAELRPGLSVREIAEALFPCGSIVGAPKIRAAEVIRGLEAASRGIYTGAIGAIAPNGELGFNVAIRTAVIGRDGQGVYGIGGGVVADSDPAGEYDEALLKGRVLARLAEPFGLIETFRWSAEAGFARLARHLDRLAGSARALGFAFDRPAVEAELEALARSWPPGGVDRRMRLELARDGAVEISHPPTAAAVPGPLMLGLADVRLDAGDPFLRHKTTRREAYDLAFAQAEQQGWDEAVLLNREGLVADGSRNSVFVERDGRLVTPAVAHGALPGVLRGALIEDGRAVEGEVRPGDLDAGPWWIGNSLHGLREAGLATPAPEAIPTRRSVRKRSISSTSTQARR